MCVILITEQGKVCTVTTVYLMFMIYSFSEVSYSRYSIQKVVKVTILHMISITQGKKVLAHGQYGVATTPRSNFFSK